jgi:hypothetical protein
MDHGVSFCGLITEVVVDPPSRLRFLLSYPKGCLSVRILIINMAERTLYLKYLWNASLSDSDVGPYFIIRKLLNSNLSKAPDLDTTNFVTCISDQRRGSDW